MFVLKSIQKSKIILAILLSSSSISAFALQQPELDNTAFVLMDYDTGVVLAQKNADKAFPPASLTKMMTAYIIEERLITGKMQETEPVKMTEEAWCRGKSTESCMYVPVNTTASALDMLKGIIIQSGNDAAKAMAQHISGSETAFADLMNEEAQKIGMSNTHFVNSTGLPAEGHYASPQDLAKLAQVIIKKSNKYYPLYSQKEFTFNKIKQGNRNSLLYTDPTVDGLKTGHTQEAGFCLVASSKRGNMRLISVIMGTKSEKDRANQSRVLLDWGFGHFATKVLAPAGQSFGSVPVAYGKDEQVGAKTLENLQILTEKNQKGKITTAITLQSNLKAPVRQGQKIGELVAMLDGKPVASVPLVAEASIEEAGFFKRIWLFIKSFF